MQMGAPGNYSLSLKITNEGAPDRLLSVQSAEAERVMVMGASTDAGLPVPAGATPSLAMDGAHGMLMGLGDVAEGRLVPVTLVFENAGEVSTRARLASGAGPGIGSSLMKNLASALGQAISTLRMEAIAYYSLPHNNLLRLEGKTGVGEESNHTATATYINNRASSIFGGSREVQKNIIARKVLGL